MRSNRDPIGRLFARLAVELEDACELAVEGQNPRLSLPRRSNLGDKLRGRLAVAATVLDRIGVEIVRHRRALR